MIPRTVGPSRPITIDGMLRIEGKGAQRYWKRVLPGEILEANVAGAPLSVLLDRARRKLYAQGHYAHPDLSGALSHVVNEKRNHDLWLALSTAGSYLQVMAFNPEVIKNHGRGIRAIKSLLERVGKDPANFEIFWKILSTPHYVSMGEEKRLAWLDEHVRKKFGNQDFTFADVGCAANLGAGTTVQAKKAFPQARVLAVDVHELAPDHAQRLTEEGVEYLRHHISGAPLPYKADVVRMAYVLDYVPGCLRRRALENAIASLNNGQGLILTHNAAYTVSKAGGKTSMECRRFKFRGLKTARGR